MPLYEVRIRFMAPPISAVYKAWIINAMSSMLRPWIGDKTRRITLRSIKLKEK